MRWRNGADRTERKWSFPTRREGPACKWCRSFRWWLRSPHRWSSVPSSRTRTPVGRRSRTGWSAVNTNHTYSNSLSQFSSATSNNVTFYIYDTERTSRNFRGTLRRLEKPQRIAEKVKNLWVSIVGSQMLQGFFEIPLKHVTVLKILIMLRESIWWERS